MYVAVGVGLAAALFLVWWVTGVENGGALTIEAHETSPVFNKTEWLRTAYEGEPGEVLSLAHIYLRNISADPVTIESIEPILGEPGLEVLGVVLGSSERHSVASYNRVEGFPPLDQARFGEPIAVDGYVLQPSTDSLQFSPLILIGVRVLEGSERATLLGVEITYRIGDLRVREKVAHSVAVCPARIALADGCVLEERSW